MIAKCKVQDPFRVGLHSCKELSNHCQTMSRMVRKDNNGAERMAVAKVVTHRKPIRMRKDEFPFGFGYVEVRGRMTFPRQMGMHFNEGWMC